MANHDAWNPPGPIHDDGPSPEEERPRETLEADLRELAEKHAETIGVYTRTLEEKNNRLEERLRKTLKEKKELEEQLGKASARINAMLNERLKDRHEENLALDMRLNPELYEEELLGRSSSRYKELYESALSVTTPPPSAHGAEEGASRFIGAPTGAPPRRVCPTLKNIILKNHIEINQKKKSPLTPTWLRRGRGLRDGDLVTRRLQQQRDNLIARVEGALHGIDSASAIPQLRSEMCPFCGRTIE